MPAPEDWSYMRDSGMIEPEADEAPYLDAATCGGFNHADLWDAYCAGARDGRDHRPDDELIQRSADAYVKSVAPTRES